MKKQVVDDFVVKVGSTKNSDNRVVFVMLRAWVRPTHIFEYDNVLDKTIRDVDKTINNMLKYSDIFNKRYIFDSSLTSINMTPSRAKFMQLGIFLKLNDKVEFSNAPQLHKATFNKMLFTIKEINKIFVKNNFILTTNNTNGD